MLDLKNDDAGHAAGGPILKKLVAVFGGEALDGIFNVGGGWLGAKRDELGNVAMKMGLLDDEWKTGMGVLVPTFRKQDDGAKISGAAPEFCQQITLNAEMLDPLAVGNLLWLG